jgi:hypothetical protein
MVCVEQKLVEHSEPDLPMKIKVPSSKKAGHCVAREVVEPTYWRFWDERTHTRSPPHYARSSTKPLPNSRTPEAGEPGHFHEGDTISDCSTPSNHAFVHQLCVHTFLIQLTHARIDPRITRLSILPRLGKILVRVPRNLTAKSAQASANSPHVYSRAHTYGFPIILS